jgi:hypothetical protein
MFGREHVGELVHVGFDQFLELEHDAAPALRVGRGPGRLGGLCCVHRALEVGRGAETDLRLHLALVRVEDVAAAVA